MKAPLVTPVAPWLAHRDRALDPTLVVLHATAGGNVSGAVETLRDRGLSYHAIVAPDGLIFKGCPLGSVAFHAGNSYGPNEAARGVSRAQNKVKEFTARPTPCVNGYSVGLAFVNLDDGKDAYDAPQVDALAWFVGEVRKQFPGIKWITTHAIVSPGRKIDPLGFDLDAFAKRVGLPVWRPS